jgi:hypothetical protein
MFKQHHIKYQPSKQYGSQKNLFDPNRNLYDPNFLISRPRPLSDFGDNSGTFAQEREEQLC